MMAREKLETFLITTAVNIKESSQEVKKKILRPGRDRSRWWTKLTGRLKN
jgi:hypothetical protein